MNHQVELQRFEDRTAAGRVLADALCHYRGADVLVLGLTRGGVPVAAGVASLLDADLDVIVARKLGAPISAELAIGAVTADGTRILNEGVCSELALSEGYLAAVTEQQLTEARKAEARLRGSRPAPRIAGRIVIVVDDGLATGATMMAALQSVKRQRPAHLIAAVPVGSREACATVAKVADEVVCLEQPEPFGAVGVYYADFSQTTDADVQALLARRRSARAVEPW
jgi:putative phosphoribosyl transferase